jgi:hypothetical protein
LTIWDKSDLRLASLAALVAEFKETKTKPERMPTIAITTKSSIRVKAIRRLDFICLRLFFLKDIIPKTEKIGNKNV